MPGHLSCLRRCCLNAWQSDSSPPNPRAKNKVVLIAKINNGAQEEKRHKTPFSLPSWYKCGPPLQPLVSPSTQECINYSDTKDSRAGLSGREVCARQDQLSPTTVGRGQCPAHTRRSQLWSGLLKPNNKTRTRVTTWSPTPFAKN